MKSVIAVSTVFKLAFLCFKVTFAEFPECISPFISSASSCQPVYPVVSESRKVYTTTINLNIKNISTPFDKNLFDSTTTNLYNATLQGFIKLDSKDPINIGTGVLKVTYTTDYLYNVLSASSKSEDVKNTIGNVLFLAEELNKDFEFSRLYYISPDQAFVFEENSICEQMACENPDYMTCVESSLDACCQSVCCSSSSFCQNGGYCFHNNFNTTPTCSCPVYEQSWYVGDHCETYLHIWMLILSSILFALIVALILGTLFYKLHILKKKTLNDLREDANKKKENKNSGLWKNKVKSVLSPINPSKWLHQFHHDKPSENQEKPPDEQPTSKQNAQKQPSVGRQETPSLPLTVLNVSALDSTPKTPPKPFPRTKIYTDVAATGLYSYAAESRDNDQGGEESLHETTSQSSFESDDDSDRSEESNRKYCGRHHYYENMHAAEEDDEPYYSVPPYQPDGDGGREINPDLPSMTTSSSVSYDEPLITTV